MKTWIAALVIAGVLLAACRLGAATTEPVPTPVPPATDTPTPVPTVTPEPEATATTPPPEPLTGQDELKAEWGPAINLAILAFETCVLMYQTHSDFGEGGIDLDTARSQLRVESDYIAIAWGDLVSVVPSEAVAPFLLSLEEQMMVLIGLLDPIDEAAIGSFEVLDTLGQTCGSLQEIQSEVVFASMEAGLTEASVDEINRDIAPMINDLYDMVMGGN